MIRVALTAHQDKRVMNKKKDEIIDQLTGADTVQRSKRKDTKGSKRV
jgi:hypothetical protein